MKRNQLVFLCILMIISVMIPMGVLAEGKGTQSEGDDIIMEAKIGFDGHYRLGAWTPITVEIENLGQDINGLIEVVVNQDASAAVSYSRPVVVAKDSKKRFVLHAQVNTIQKKFNIRLKQNEKTIKSFEVRSLIPMTLDKYLIGVITDDKPALGYWWRTLGEGSIFTNHDTVHIKPDEIPERIEVIDNFAILVINNVDTSTLAQEQRKVLSQWVSNGGILIIGTGPNAAKTLSGINPDIVDAQIGDIFESDPIKEIEDMAGTFKENIKLDLVDLNVREGQKYIDDNDRGIVWGLQKGRGRIFISAFDLGLEPIMSWQGNKVFWETILTKNLNPDMVATLRDPNLISNKNQKYIHSQTYQIREALGSIKALDLPSFTNLIIILLGYLLVVGPINYIILKKLDRREWAWFTIPVFVVLFSIGIYAMGFVQKGNEIIVNAISTINLNKNASAGIDTYAGVFIPRRGDYDISVDKDTLLTLFGEDDMDGMHYPNPIEERQRTIKARVSQGNPSSITLYDSNVWTMRTLVLKDFNTDFGDIKGELFYQDGKIKGTVTNNTPYPLEDVVIYTPTGSYEKIGNIVTGGEKEIDLSISNSAPQYGGGPQHGGGYDNLYMMLDDLYPYPYSRGGAPSDEDRDMWIKRNLIEGTIMGDTDQNLASSGYVNILGFCDYRPKEKIKINGAEPSAFQYTGMVISGLDIDYEKDGVVSTPPGYIKGVLNKELSGNIFPEAMGFYLEYGQAIFDFNMSPYMGLDLSKVEISARPLDGSIVLSLYDFEKSGYIDAHDNIIIDRASGTITIKPDSLKRFVDDKGILRINIQSREKVYTTFEAPSLVIEGRKY